MAIDRYATATMGAALEPDPSHLVRAVRARTARDGVELPAIALSSDFPVGSGLGGSSAAGVALGALVASLGGRPIEHDAHRSDIARWSRAVEIEEMGIAGGWQDHYAAAFGGALGLTFGRETTVERIPLTAACTDELERRCILAYTGESRISAATITAVLDAYRDRTPAVVDALEHMGVLARGMRDALAASDIDTLASLVAEHWIRQRSLHPGITTQRIDAIEHAAREAGSPGMKALGASGGGCVIVFAPAHDAGRVAAAVSQFATIMPWHVASAGVTVETVAGATAHG